MKRRWPRQLLRIVLVLLVLVVGVAGLLLRASLPWLDGQFELAGLQGPVKLERDALGSVSIRASNRLDLARATGYAHAQDRFFQMDLLRRSSAGELAELFGARALDFDRQRRLHRMRHRAGLMLANQGAEQQALLQAYAEGVNSGLNALRAPPFEYLLLSQRPRRWTAEDSLLSAMAMYFDLQESSAATEASLAWLYDCLPNAADFLAPPGTAWDAALSGGPLPLPALPDADQFDTRKASAPAWASGDQTANNELAQESAQASAWTPWGNQIESGEQALGSNNWAVSGALTQHGAALVADDMHLGLRLPHIWYRLRLIEEQAGDGIAKIDISGVSLPGLPFIVVGSNRHIAWGFTNSYGDFLDLIPLQLVDNDPTHYQTPDGERGMTLSTETIAVAGAAAVQLVVRETQWGPVIGEDHRGRPLVWRWVAHDQTALTLTSFQALEQLLDVESALKVAQRTGIPGQNFVVGDADGQIGWTIIGQIPRRSPGFSGRLPGNWANGEAAWQGWLDAAEYPQSLNPAQQRIWTANARVANGAALQRLGDGGYALGARAGQIRDRLMALEQADESDMLAIHLDDEAQFLARWRRFLLAELDSRALAEHAGRATLRELVLQWSGRAVADDAGYRLVREFRDRVRNRLYQDWTRQCPNPPGGRSYRGGWQAEGPLWRVLQERPAHFLPPEWTDWSQFILSQVDELISAAEAEAGQLADYRWGERNRLNMAHPMASGIPLFGRWLQMPAQALDGDRDMPRVQGRSFGASQRMAVSPGQEASGYLQLPGGASGHPLSAYFDAGHEDWVDGRPTPFLPGPAEHVLELFPQGSGL